MAHSTTATADRLARPDLDLVRRAPKVLLHEHLDGGLRPRTILELAELADYRELPEREPAKLADWFAAGAARGSLSLYLEGFRHTIALMQTASALERVAHEFVEDMARDNVVYAEVRFAPHFHTAGGLGLDGVMSAVLRGLERGRSDFGVDVGLIVCGMRNLSPMLSFQMAELAVAHRTRGCVGFDLAGEEAGHPAKHHIEAFQLVKRMNFSITIHAGESFGPESIWQALQHCGAHRIGHGTRLAEDPDLLRYVRDHRVPLEMCLSSNVQTRVARSLKVHPFGQYFRMGLRVTLNTDNRLMSATTSSQEIHLAARAFRLSPYEVKRIVINGFKSAFLPYPQKARMLREVNLEIDRVFMDAFPHEYDLRGSY